MSDLKKAKIQWNVVEKYTVFSVARLEFKDGNNVIGYYRIWHSPETENIAYYGNDSTRRGILPPGEYKVKAESKKMVGLIKADMEKMGYEVPGFEDMLDDMIIVGEADFPHDWAETYSMEESIRLQCEKKK